MQALTCYRGEDTHVGRETAARICSRAEKLSQVLLNPVHLADQSRESSARSTSRTVPPGTYPRMESILVLEPAVDISRYVTKLGTQAFTGGGYSDVWKGVYITTTSREMVRIIHRSTAKYLHFDIGCHQVFEATS